MNWFALLKIALGLVPNVVQAVEVIATEAHTGADKRQLAVDAIKLGAGIADTTLSPEDQKRADAVASIVGSAVDATCSANNVKHGWLAKSVGIASTVVKDAAGIALVVAG